MPVHLPQASTVQGWRITGRSNGGRRELRASGCWEQRCLLGHRQQLLFMVMSAALPRQVQEARIAYYTSPSGRRIELITAAALYFSGAFITGLAPSSSPLWNWYRLAVATAATLTWIIPSDMSNDSGIEDNSVPSASLTNNSLVPRTISGVRSMDVAIAEAIRYMETAANEVIKDLTKLEKKLRHS